MNLKEIYIAYPTRQHCLKALENILWDKNPTCPYCGEKKSTPLKKEDRHHCNYCNMSFSVTTGTIFNKTKCDLQKWFYIIDRVLSNNLDSIRNLSNEIETTKDTVWLMLKKIESARIENHNLLLKINEQLKPPKKQKFAGMKLMGKRSINISK